MADNELSESELQDLVNSLTSNCCQVVEKSLLKLHKHFGMYKHFRSSRKFWHSISTRDVIEFYKIGGLTNILQLLLKPNEKWTEKAIGILTICCHVKECRKMISNTETISLITSIFKSFDKNETIQVFLCKTIINLSYQEEARTIFHNLDINSAIIDLLLYCQLSDSNHVATRTLQCLNSTRASREQIIQIILTKFNPTDNDLTIKILRIIAKLTGDIYSEIPAQQIRTTIGIENLVTYAQSIDEIIQGASIEILTHISRTSNVIRREMGEAGMVPIYINRIQRFLHDDESRPLYGLRQLLCHVDNRDRLFQTVDGFETLISLLRRLDGLKYDEEANIAIDAIGEFFPGFSGRFLVPEEYNESHILKFLNLDLVSILVNVLNNYVKTRDSTHELIEGTKSVILNDCSYSYKIQEIINIFTAISAYHKFHFRFLNSVILDLFLRGWSFGSYHKRFKDIVMPLVRNDVCFEDLILLQFPQMVRKIMDDSVLQHSVGSCFACEYVQFCKGFILREFERKVHSEYGLENINRLLTTGNESVKRTVALILPHILATEVENYNQVSGVYYLALESFLKNLADPSNDNYQVSLNIFFEICEKGQSSDINSFSHKTHKRDYCVFNGEEFDEDVHFILDDGERVSANRSILTQSSDMFDAMLNGHFMEANQSEIRFKCASAEMFKFILHFLYGCTDSGETSCPVLRNAHYEFLFEACDMSDRMMLMNLKSFILRIIAKKLTVCSALSACRYAQQNNYTTFLSVLVDHLVKSSVGKDYKTKLFTQILSSDLTEHLIAVIKLKIESVKSLHFLRFRY